MTSIPWISLMIWMPLLAGIRLVFLSGPNHKQTRHFGMGISLLTSAIGIILWLATRSSGSGEAFAEQFDWIPTLGVRYSLGMDGLSGLMVLLTALIMPFAYAASWRIDHDEPKYFGCLLIIQGSLVGVFTATNFFLWFFFYEISLIPAFFLVRLWGSPGKDRSSLRFLIYSMVGSISLLVGFLALAAATGTFEFATIAELSSNGTLLSVIGSNLGWYDMHLGWLCAVIFALIFFGLAIKVPMIPFHSWLPDTYDHAPTPATMILTGLMSKMGLYGLIRMGIPMFPYAIGKLLTPLLIITVFGIVYSAFAAMGQRNLKRMLAYSSINHLGYCLLGLLALGLATNGEMKLAIHKTSALGGVMLQMFAHGIIASVLFYFANILEVRTGDKVMIDEHGGLRHVAPLLAGTMGLAVFASVGLPGLNGFIGEFLIFKGVFGLVPWAAVMAIPALLITAVFLLGLLQKLFHGPADQSANGFHDLSLLDAILVAPFVILMVVLGFFPHLILDGLNPVINEIISAMRF
jgi:NADH-quinone oxidoreductase subunit M